MAFWIAVPSANLLVATWRAEASTLGDSAVCNVAHSHELSGFLSFHDGEDGPLLPLPGVVKLEMLYHQKPSRFETHLHKLQQTLP